MIAQIVKWGNSQGVRLPKGMMETAGMHVNDEVSVVAEKGKIVIEKTKPHRTLEERAAAYGNKLGPYHEFEWGEPAGREFF